MPNTEWWQRGPVEGVPAVLQPVAHILLQVGESADELVENLTESEWNARPTGVASAAFHVRRTAGGSAGRSTHARCEGLSEEQCAAIRREGDPPTSDDVPAVMAAL